MSLPHPDLSGLVVAAPGLGPPQSDVVQAGGPVSGGLCGPLGTQWSRCHDLFSSSCLQTPGKDRIIFVTKEDHETPSNAELVADDPNDPYEEHGEWRGAPATTGASWGEAQC